jgi:MinD superfamily P-loop ATPase
MLKLQHHAAVHISVTFGTVCHVSVAAGKSSHFSIALHVVVVDADVDPANDITLLHVAVTDEVVVIVAPD